MEIRKLETEEKQNTKKLYEEVFSEDSKSFVDYYYIVAGVTRDSDS